MTINLDDMTTDANEMIAWWNTYQHASKAQCIEIFGHADAGAKRALKDLANYAANKGTAMQCRARGDIATAQSYESICERIYSNLPEFARW